MRILYMGTASFAIPSLKALLKSGHTVIGVVTQPDRPSGRGRQLHASPVKELAQEAGIPIYQPERVRSEEFVSTVRTLAPDCIVVAAFGQILPKSVLDIPKYGNINVHGSLLPKYRGAAPVHYALFEGEKETGVTTMLMSTGPVDSGPILLQAGTEILPGDDQASLESRLAEMGAELLIETLKGVESGSVTPVEQDTALVTLSPSVKREDCAIDWNWDAARIVNRVRGCSPRIGAYVQSNRGTLKIWSSSVRESQSTGIPPGEIVSIDEEGIAVQAGNGLVLLSEVQPENKKRMKAAEFARGYRILVGSTLQVS